MRFLLFYIFLVLFTCSQVFAGLPPTTTKGQSDASKATTFNFQVPYSQSTKTAAVTNLLETGNNNLLVNAGFEHETATTGWTQASGTSCVVDTSVVSEGKKSLLCTMTAVNGLSLSQDVTPTIKMQGMNFEHGVAIATTSTTLQVCPRNAGATAGSCVTVPSDNILRYYPANLPGPASGSVGVSVFTTGSTTGSYYIDEGYVGKARNIGTVAQAFFFGGMEQASSGNVGCIYSENTSTGLTDSIALGTATNCSAWTVAGNVTATGTNDHRPILSNMGAGAYIVKILGVVDSSATQTCIFKLSDGTTTWQPQNTYVGSTGGANAHPMLEFHLYYTTAPGTKTLTIAASDDGSGACRIYNGSTGTNFAWKVYYFPSFNQTAVRMDQSNYDWRSYTPTLTGFGTPTNIECQEKRDGSDNLIRCKFTSGTPTAVEARVSLPGSNVAADTNKIPSIQISGKGVISATGAIDLVTLQEPSVAYLTFGVQNATTAGTGKLNGSAFTANGTVVTFFARVPIQGWVENQNAPLLVGGVTSNTSGLERIERATITPTSNAACTVSNESGDWLGSTTPTATGDCTVAINSSMFSSTPVCVATVIEPSTNADQYVAKIVSTSTSSVRVTNSARSAAGGSASSLNANPINIMCMGPR